MFSPVDRARLLHLIQASADDAEVLDRYRDCWNLDELESSMTKRRARTVDRRSVTTRCARVNLGQLRVKRSGMETEIIPLQ